MSNPTMSEKESGNQVYGFLCQQTNVFYAFESYETYAEFLLWLAQENAPAINPHSQADIDLRCPIPSEDEQLAEAQLATDEIMRVFEDPVFSGCEEAMELEEVDF